MFNRRYPKCERCHVELPASLVYGADELSELKRRDAEEAVAQAQSKARLRADNGPPYIDGGSFDGGTSVGGDFSGPTDIGSCGGD